MGKNHISIPEKFIFETTIPVRITDINYGGHAGNDSILSLIHEARMQFLYSLDLSEMNFGGVALIMSDLAVDFKAEIMYGDNTLIRVSVSEISKASFNLIYQIIITRNDKETVAANVRTGMVCFDYAAKKIRAIPGSALIKIKPGFFSEDL